jgi:hypothetical protein
MITRVARQPRQGRLRAPAPEPVVPVTFRFADAGSVPIDDVPATAPAPGERGAP